MLNLFSWDHWCHLDEIWSRMNITRKWPALLPWIPLWRQGRGISKGHSEGWWGHPVCANSLAAFSADLHKHHFTARWETHLKHGGACSSSQELTGRVRSGDVVLCSCARSFSSRCPGFAQAAAWRANDLTLVLTTLEHHLMWFQKLL